MNAMAEKLKDAGVDTIGARLTTACVEGLRRHPNDIAAAWRYAGEAFGLEFVRGLMGDMKNTAVVAAYSIPRTVPSQAGWSDGMVSPKPKPYQPRVVAPERLEKRRELQQLVRSKYLNSGGVAWSDVSWHELSGLKRDGMEAVALLEAIPQNLPNDGRTVGEVLGIKKVDEIIAQVRALK